jgi:hypothetical protein
MLSTAKTVAAPTQYHAVATAAVAAVAVAGAYAALVCYCCFRQLCTAGKSHDDHAALLLSL